MQKNNDDDDEEEEMIYGLWQEEVYKYLGIKERQGLNMQ